MTWSVMCFEPLAVDAAAVHHTGVARLHFIGDPAFCVDAEFVDETVGFCFVEAFMEFPAMSRVLSSSFFFHLLSCCMVCFLLIVFGKAAWLFFLGKKREKPE